MKENKKESLVQMELSKKSIFVSVVEKMSALNQNVLLTLASWRVVIGSLNGLEEALPPVVLSAENVGQVFKQTFLSVPCSFVVLTLSVLFVPCYQINRFILKRIFVFTGQNMLLRFFPKKYGVPAFLAFLYFFCYIFGILMLINNYQFKIANPLLSIFLYTIGYLINALAVVLASISIVKEFETAPVKELSPFIGKIFSFFSNKKASISSFLNTKIATVPLTSFEEEVLLTIDQAYKNHSLPFEQLNNPLTKESSNIKMFFTYDNQIMGINVSSTLKEIVIYNQQTQEIKNVSSKFGLEFFKQFHSQVSTYSLPATTEKSSISQVEDFVSQMDLKAIKGVV